MMELIRQLGFLPLLVSDISGFSAEEMADEECRYIVYPDGGWDWPLWKWKGIIINESDASMASSSAARRDLSAARGGGISATGVAVSIPCRRMAV